MIKKRFISMLALLCLTVSGAWAQITLLTTILNSGDNASFTSGSKTFDNKATVTFSGEVANDGGSFGWNSGSERTLTVTAAEGYNITRVKFYTHTGSGSDEQAPFEAILVNDGGIITKVNGTRIGWGGVTKIEVYGYGTPTYRVSLKGGTEDATSWQGKAGTGEYQALPLEGVALGRAVSVKYSGRKLVKSVKAKKNPIAEDKGKLICTDGHIHAYGEDAECTKARVAKIIYIGPTGHATYNHGLALALEDVSGTQTWCSQTSNTCLTTQYSSASDAKGDMAGLANTDALVGHGSHTHAAANAARNYNSGTHPTGTSAWFLPSAGQWDKMATAASGYNNLGLQSDYYYWSSSESRADYAWSFNPDNGKWILNDKYYGFLVRACLAF